MSKKESLEQQIRAERSAVLIVNTRSRSGERLFFRALDALEEHGITIAASYPLRYYTDFPVAAREAIHSGHRLIIVGGGDGTVSSLVDDFVYRDVALGLLPLGTANNFARTLGIPEELDKAIGVIAHGKIADVNLGKVGGDHFANAVDIGITATIARETPHLLKRFLGPLAYALTGIRIILTHKAFLTTFRTPERTFSYRTHEIIVANGRFLGATVVSEEASVMRRQLVVYTMEDMSRWTLLRLWIAFLQKKHAAFAGTHHFMVDDVIIETTPPKIACADGEPTAKTPVHFTLAPAALKVLVPSSFTEV